MTIPELRNDKEKQLFEKMYLHGRMWGNTTDEWYADISREVDMTNDRKYFVSENDADTLFLAYPGDSGSANPAGSVTKQSVYEIGGKKIFVVTVDFGTISSRGGLFAFGHNLSLGLKNILHPQKQ